MLGGATIPVVCQHQKAEIVLAGNPRRFDAEEAVVPDVLVMLPERHEHVLAPRVRAFRGPEVPDAGSPGLGVEKVIIVPPDGVDGDEDGGDRQTRLQAPAQGRTGRGAHLSQSPKNLPTRPRDCPGSIRANVRCQPRRSRGRVNLRQARCTGRIKPKASSRAMPMSPTTATSGSIMPTGVQ